MAEVERCFNKGLLQKRGPSIDLARKSIRQADIFLKDAGKLIDSDMTRMSVLALYNAFFHAARALLFGRVLNHVTWTLLSSFKSVTDIDLKYYTRIL